MDTPSDDMLDDDSGSFALANSEDHAILMHRDAHFAGSFNVMIEYYELDGKGVNPQFELYRIKELAALEAAMGNNLAATLLSAAEAEKIGKAKNAYTALRDLYAIRNPKNRLPLLIADLILSEEEEPNEEIDAIVAEKDAIVPLLIQLLRSEDFSDPLFPGYGTAPTLAARCLGRIGDKRAIIALFEAIGEADIFNEECILEALHAIGEPAKAFLLPVLRSRPVTIDNERAAVALVQFRNQPDVAMACFSMLLDSAIWSDTLLTMHLLLTCEALQGRDERLAFAALADNAQFPKLLQQDIRVISKNWLL